MVGNFLVINKSPFTRFYKAKDVENAKVAMTAIESKLIPLLKVFAADDISISCIAVPFFNAYISVLKLVESSEQKKLFVKVGG